MLGDQRSTFQMSGKGWTNLHLASVVLWMYCNLLCINIWSTGWCGIWQNSWSTTLCLRNEEDLHWNVWIEYSNIFMPTLTVCFHFPSNFPKAVLFHFFIQIWDTSVYEILACSFKLPGFAFLSEPLEEENKENNLGSSVYWCFSRYNEKPKWSCAHRKAYEINQCKLRGLAHPSFLCWNELCVSFH